MTKRNESTLHFQGHGRRDVVAQFDGGMITSDAGGLLLREVDETFDVIGQFAGCFQAQLLHHCFRPDRFAERASSIDAAAECLEFRLGLRRVDVLQPMRTPRHRPGRQQ